MSFDTGYLEERKAFLRDAGYNRYFGDMTYTCRECFALVGNRDIEAHEGWHDNLNQPLRNSGRKLYRGSSV